jgi:RHS repeat-associated protein
MALTPSNRRYPKTDHASISRAKRKTGRGVFNFDHRCRSGQTESVSSCKTRHSCAGATTSLSIRSQCTQQYSINALTNSGGTIVERYAYSAYGEPTITDGSGTVRASTAEGNRYTYTGREWDDVAELHHYRARWYDPVMGRFLGRDPIGYVDGNSLYRAYFAADDADPSGLSCKGLNYFCMCRSGSTLGVASGRCTCCEKTTNRKFLAGAMILALTPACHASCTFACGSKKFKNQPVVMQIALQISLRSLFGPSVSCFCT